MVKDFLGKGTIQKVASLIAILALVVSVFLLTAFFIKNAVHSEAQKTKTEVVERVKSLGADSMAKSVAKALHAVSSFKTKVKKEFNKLDSLDTVRTTE
jgi:hypothetical protein